MAETAARAKADQKKLAFVIDKEKASLNGINTQQIAATVRLALDDQGLDGVGFELRVTCTPYPRDCHAGTSVVTVVVSSRVDLPLMPSALGGQAPSFALDATHTVPIGQFQETHDQP